MKNYFASLSVPGRIESVRAVAAFVVAAARSLKIDAASNSLFEVAIVEALTNALKHGGTPENPSTITCELEVDERSLKVRVLDQGAGLPAALGGHIPVTTWPDIAPEDWAAIPASGYGLPIIQAVFPEVKAIFRHDCAGIEMAMTL